MHEVNSDSAKLDQIIFGEIIMTENLSFSMGFLPSCEPSESIFSIKEVTEDFEKYLIGFSKRGLDDPKIC
jgi:hypothetical protein